MGDDLFTKPDLTARIVAGVPRLQAAWMEWISAPTEGNYEDKVVDLLVNTLDVHASDQLENLRGEFSASGMTTVNRKCVSLWLAIQDGDTFWPRTEGPVTIDERGNWSQTVTERGDPAKLALTLWASNTSATSACAMS